MPRFLTKLLPVCLLAMLVLSGCISSLIGKQPAHDFSEQFYVDARLNFAVKHPLDWQRLQVPVASPEYRADTARWTIEELEADSRGTGEILIRSLPAKPARTLSDLLSQFLASQSELTAGQPEHLELPAGPALKLLGEDDKQGRLTIAIKGQQRDFIISFDYPASRFAELLPIFDDIVTSFVEIIPPPAQNEPG